LWLGKISLLIMTKLQANCKNKVSEMKNNIYFLSPYFSYFIMNLLPTIFSKYFHKLSSFKSIYEWMLLYYRTYSLEFWIICQNTTTIFVLVFYFVWRQGFNWPEKLINLAACFVARMPVSKTKLNSVALVRKRTIPTERPPLVGEVSANLCG
jgi:hypothetical protein